MNDSSTSPNKLVPTFQTNGVTLDESPFIRIAGISKQFGGVMALSNFSLDIQQGEFHALVGENGAGKSTLMKILSGVITEYDGELWLRDQTVRFRNTREAEQAGISIIHQELNLVNELSVAANIFLGREFKNRMGWLDDRRMEYEAQAIFNELECHIDPKRPVYELRVGDQQLVEIAKALSLNAEILVMDEPTSALTSSEVDRLFRVVHKLLARGVTVIYISHKLDEVFRMSQRITILRDGQKVVTLTTRETTLREVTHHMVGRQIEQREQIARRERGPVILKVDRLSLPHAMSGHRDLLREISFELHSGEVLGIAGLMGAGRTELLESLFGATSEDPQGTISIAGRPVTFRHPEEAVQQGLALVPEDRKRQGLFSHMNVRENISLCSLAELATIGVVQRHREMSHVDDAIALLSVKTGNREAAITSLSGGNQQKCIMARWLETRPSVLLLDDPTRGVDVGAKAELYQIIDRLCAEGLGIIVTSSELPELITLCDRILVLCEGELTGEFSRDEFSEHVLMEAATRRNRS
ncbi:MAG: sugar ABC transporter ATP-binding protein [Planctomycetota bacterium]|nr:sugar ABC transporter ATP-binding protein [Planctomycetota bacterium]MDA1210927.1 sugar ABC transporter ATP-binding protein [Planctomycetota bacterium]